VFAACIQLLRQVAELAATIVNDDTSDVHALARKAKARACVLAVINALQNLLVSYNIMNASDALAVAHYIARPAALRDTTLWQQWLACTTGSGEARSAVNMNDTATMATTQTAISNTTANIASTTTATTTSSTAATDTSCHTTVSSAVASTSATSSAIASQDPRVQALAVATAEKLNDKFKPQLQRVAVLKQQLHDTLSANAAAVAAKQREYEQIEQQEREKYAALLQQLEQNQQNEQQRVQHEAMRLVKQLAGAL
jgi:hypothetical protein